MIGNRFFTQSPIVPFVMALGILVGIAIYGIVAEAPEVVVGSSEIGGFNPQRVAQAEAERLTGLAEMYAAQQLKVEKARAAESARLEGLAKHYRPYQSSFSEGERWAPSESGLSRRHSVEAERLTGLAQAILTKENMTRQVEIDRLTGLAAHYEGLRASEREDLKFLMEGWAETVTQVNSPSSVEQKFSDPRLLQLVTGSGDIDRVDQKFSDPAWLDAVK